MKNLFLILLLVAFITGTPVVTPVSYAVSRAKMESSIVQHQGDIKPLKQKVKKSRTRLFNRSRVSIIRDSAPEQVFIVGLLTLGFGIGLLISIDKRAEVGLEGIATGVLIKLFGTLAIIVGTMVTIIGGISWIFDKRN